MRNLLLPPEFTFALNSGITVYIKTGTGIRINPKRLGDITAVKRDHSKVIDHIRFFKLSSCYISVSINNRIKAYRSCILALNIQVPFSKKKR